MLVGKGCSRVSAWLLDDYLASSLDTLVRQSRVKVLEDFFFTQFSESFSFEPDSRYFSSFGFGLSGLSFNGFSTNALREKSPLYARGVTAVGYFAGFFGPSAPYSVSLIGYCVFAASKQLARWGTINYFCQNCTQPFCSKILNYISQLLRFSLVCKPVTYCVYKPFLDSSVINPTYPKRRKKERFR